MDENDVEIRERITAVESSVKSLHKRVDKQESLIENIRSIVEEVKYMREDLNKIESKVTEIEQKPAKKWELVGTGLISAVVGALGMVIVQLVFGG